MTNNELLLAISEMLDQKLDSELKPIKSDIHSMQNDIHVMQDDMRTMQDDIHTMKLFEENIILPRLNTIESCYTETYDRYRNYTDKFEAVFEDVELLKKVVSEHSETLRKTS